MSVSLRASRPSHKRHPPRAAKSPSPCIQQGGQFSTPSRVNFTRGLTRCRRHPLGHTPNDLLGTLNSHFRAVVSEERKWKTQLNKGRKKEKYLETTHWRWLTSLPEIYSAPTVHLFGHARWDIENRGFNELAGSCHFDHPFCHPPNALLAMLIVISLAFNILYAFFERNLKPALRAGIRTRAQLAVELLVSLPRVDRAYAPGHT